MAKISIEYLRSCIRYDSGKLYWLERPKEHFKSDQAYQRWNNMFASKEAGWLAPNKFGARWRLSVNGVTLPRTSVVWALANNAWPELNIDHINRECSDDRIENLRSATNTQNNGNMKRSSRNTSGYKGVSFCKSGKKWSARIKAHGKNHWLGYFENPSVAHVAYAKAAERLFGEFACAG